MRYSRDDFELTFYKTLAMQNQADILKQRRIIRRLNQKEVFLKKFFYYEHSSFVQLY